MDYERDDPAGIAARLAGNVVYWQAGAEWPASPWLVTASPVTADGSRMRNLALRYDLSRHCS
jgi:hypothetical protein